ncbi:hypothetical protein [Celerinatantimonas sp. MCCC 1A17872]|uniref:hypothetical protein n=1 Tax=Celerinatantimonas sp. MCCC 1A17872 TaxID=3177514 RepID=UPI0038C7136A
MILDINNALENQLYHAVIAFYAPRENWPASTSFDDIAEITQQLPLKKLQRWERVIQMALRRALIVRNEAHFISWLDVMHYDGYVRERALRALQRGAPSRFFFAQMLRRLNDWAEPVRKAARESLLNVASLTPSDWVIDSLIEAILRFPSWGRADDVDKQALVTISELPEIQLALKQQIITGSSGPMPRLLMQLCCSAAWEAHLPVIAIDAIQPAVRAIAYRFMLEGYASWYRGQAYWQLTDKKSGARTLIGQTQKRQLTQSYPTWELIFQAAQDRSGIVRRVSAEFLIKNLSDDVNQARLLAEQFASDKAQAVRFRGDFALRKLNELTNAAD